MKLCALIVSLAVAATTAAPLNTTAITKRDDHGIPKCAVKCLKSALASHQCGWDDVTCGCPHFESIKSAAGPCIVTNCGIPATKNKVVPAVKSICSNF